MKMIKLELHKKEDMNYIKNNIWIAWKKVFFKLYQKKIKFELYEKKSELNCIKNIILKLYKKIQLWIPLKKSDLNYI